MPKRKTKTRRVKRVCPTHYKTLVPANTKYGTRWSCIVEGCTVVCWSGSTSTPADYETRQARHQVHELLDPLWEDPDGPFCEGERPNRRGVRRSRAYRWLSEQLGKELDKTHIGYFDLQECRKAIELLKGGRYDSRDRQD